MGSPPTEPDHQDREIQHLRVIPRRFAIASKEVTVEQYQRFVKTNLQYGLLPIYLARYSPDGAGPVNGVHWFGAAAYCNWLSEQEGLDKCYEQSPKEEIWKAMETIPADELLRTIPADVLLRNGYRLPTEAEWEYTCRSGTITSRYYGVSTDLLDRYAWYRDNSQGHAWPGGSLLPNELGLFDILGNVDEWVQDRPGRSDHTNDEIRICESVNRLNDRLLRGGAFNVPPAYVRSAVRNWDQTLNRSVNCGFRPSRTYH